MHSCLVVESDTTNYSIIGVFYFRLRGHSMAKHGTDRDFRRHEDEVVIKHDGIGFERDFIIYVDLA